MPGAVEPREYQVVAAAGSSARNTLVVLPTGLGKTIVAVLHVVEVLKGAAGRPEGCIVTMIAPTRALLVQHQLTFRKALALPPEAIEIVDGGTAPAAREKHYQSILAGTIPAILFMTPQTLSNDLLKRRFPAAAVASVILDEAHHATGDHPYVLILRGLAEQGGSQRVLGLTASPGDNTEGIQVLCDTLGIDPARAIFKSREDADVKRYTFPVRVQQAGVDLPPEMQAALDGFTRALADRCAWLVAAGLETDEVFDMAGMRFKKEIPKTHFLDLFKASPPGAPMSVIAQCIKVHHAAELLVAYGPGPVVEFHEGLLARLATKPSKATAAIVTDHQYASSVDACRRMVAAGVLHPKLDALRPLVARFVGANPGSRVLVFVKYRATIPAIIASLSGVPGVAPRKFVGQGDRTGKDKGMKRKDQGKVLDDFQAGACNVLVATSVAEEGLDIAECDLVVFYETVASVVKFIQRAGRTGRKRAGTVAIMYTRGTTDEFRMGALDGKLARLREVHVVDTGRGRRGSVDALLHDVAGAGEVPVTIQATRRWQGSAPLVMNERFPRAAELAGWLQQAGVPASLVPRSGLPSVLLGKAFACEVLEIAAARSACMDNSIFPLVAGLAAAYRKPAVVLLGDGNDEVEAWVGAICKAAGVVLLRAGSVPVLGLLLQDVRRASLKK